MVVILRPGTTEKEIEKLENSVEKYGVTVSKVVGTERTILGLIGDTTKVDPYVIEANRNVERVMHVAEPFKKANRMFHPDPTIVKVGNITIGGGQIAVIAGPCSVESSEQILNIAREVKKSGAHLLRGGAFKPRTSPYAFQGMKYEGLALLKQAREETGLPIVTEIMCTNDIDLFQREVDIIQVGARNMQNFDLLRRLGEVNKPVILKRGMSATIEEWLMAAEYILSGGNQNVILCERGIRTFETYTRNVADLGAVPVIKKLSHLPVIVDPSHATGKWWMVPDMTKAAIAVGADGVLIEVHNDPVNALSDGQQSIKPCVFNKLMQDIRQIAKAVGREV